MPFGASSRKGHGHDAVWAHAGGRGIGVHAVQQFPARADQQFALRQTLAGARLATAWRFDLYRDSSFDRLGDPIVSTRHTGSSSAVWNLSIIVGCAHLYGSASRKSADQCFWLEIFPSRSERKFSAPNGEQVFRPTYLACAHSENGPRQLPSQAKPPQTRPSTKRLIPSFRTHLRFHSYNTATH
jgi:hypothetical protein